MVPTAAPARLAARPAARSSRSSRRATRPVAAATVDAAAAVRDASPPPSRPPPPQWAPAPLPGSLPELLSLVSSPAVSSTLADAQSAQYWAYALGRGAFFTAQAVLASAVTTGALGAFTQRLERQAASVAPPNGAAGLDWNAGDARGLAGLLASQAELYRRELEHIKNGVYRAPYDSDPRHRQVRFKAALMLASTRLRGPDAHVPFFCSVQPGVHRGQGCAAAARQRRDGGAARRARRRHGGAAHRHRRGGGDGAAARRAGGHLPGLLPSERASYALLWRYRIC